MMNSAEVLQTTSEDKTLSGETIPEGKIPNSSDSRELFLEKLGFHCDVVASIAFKMTADIENFLNTLNKPGTQINSKAIKNLKLFQNISIKPDLITEDILKSFISFKKSLIKLHMDAAAISDIKKPSEAKNAPSKTLVKQRSRMLDAPYEEYFSTEQAYVLLSDNIDRCISQLQNINFGTTTFAILKRECLEELNALKTGISSGNALNFKELLKTINSDFTTVCEKLQPRLEENQKKSILEIDADCKNLIDLLENVFNNFSPNLLNSKFIEHKKISFGLIPQNNLWQQYLDLNDEYSETLQPAKEYFKSSDDLQNNPLETAQRNLQGIKASDEMRRATKQLFKNFEQQHHIPSGFFYRHDDKDLNLLKNSWVPLLLAECDDDDSQQNAEDRAKISRELINLKDIDIIKAATIFNYILPPPPLKKFYADKVLTTIQSKAFVDESSPLELRFLIELTILFERANLTRASIHKTSSPDMITFLKKFRTELGKLCEQAKKLQDSFQTYDPITNSWQEKSIRELITFITNIQHKDIKFYNETLFLLPSPQEEDIESHLKENPKTKDKESSHHRRRSLGDYWATLFPNKKPHPKDSALANSIASMKVEEESHDKNAETNESATSIPFNLSSNSKEEEEKSNEDSKIEAERSKMVTRSRSKTS